MVIERKNSVLTEIPAIPLTISCTPKSKLLTPSTGAHLHAHPSSVLCVITQMEPK